MRSKSLSSGGERHELLRIEKPTTTWTLEIQVMDEETWSRAVQGPMQRRTDRCFVDMVASRAVECIEDICNYPQRTEASAVRSRVRCRFCVSEGWGIRWTTGELVPPRRIGSCRIGRGGPEGGQRRRGCLAEW